MKSTKKKHTKKNSSRKAASKKPYVRKTFGALGEKHIERVRAICMALPGASEKLSHGEPTFFAGKVFAMISNNHHNDGHMAVWVPAAPGVQEELVSTEPAKYYRPPYVGSAGWVGIELPAVSDDELGFHITEAHRMIAPKKLRPTL